MNLDFTTISLTGVIAICAIVTGLVIVFFIIFKNVRALSIKTNMLTVETQERTKILETKTKEEAFTKTKNYVKRQSALAKHHIGVIAGDLRDLFTRTYKLTQEEKNMVYILVDLFVAELHRQIVDNFTENHIGKTDEEIETYTKMRAREYTSFAKSFFDDYDWTMPRFRLKDALKYLPPDYFFMRLATLYKDGKSIEKGE